MNKVRPAVHADLEDIMAVFDLAKIFMAQSGNPNQWHDGYPWDYIVEEDIESNSCYIIEENGCIAGTFVFRQGDEPGYDEIRGKWLNDLPYGVIHRIASNGNCKGILETALKFCSAINPNIKIDTHEDNKVMQAKLEKYGFVKCGLIVGSDGVDRIAYQKYFI